LIPLTGAAELIKSELINRHGTSEAFFSEDFVGDMESWIALMRGLLGNADVFRFADRKLIIEQRRVHIYGDIVMPAVNQIKKLLDERDFKPWQIVVEKFEEIPRLWLDSKLMAQVIFNLLTNAIKYADDNPKKFRVRILGRETPRFYEIDFCDSGPGIEPEIKEAIFLEGVRSEHAEQRNVAGDGLGLWIARRAAMAHGGNIQLTKCEDPTTFTIFLPKTLAHRKKIDREQSS
jgi:signal transduction histidine kinase